MLVEGKQTDSSVPVPDPATVPDSHRLKWKRLLVSVALICSDYPVHEVSRWNPQNSSSKHEGIRRSLICLPGNSLECDWWFQCSWPITILVLTWMLTSCWDAAFTQLSQGTFGVSKIWIIVCTWKSVPGVKISGPTAYDETRLPYWISHWPVPSLMRDKLKRTFSNSQVVD